MGVAYIHCPLEETSILASSYPFLIIALGNIHRVYFYEIQIYRFSLGHLHCRLQHLYRNLPFNPIPALRHPFTLHEHRKREVKLKTFYRYLGSEIATVLQSWPKISGQIPKLNTKYIPVPPPSPPPPPTHAMLSSCCVYVKSD